MDGDGSGFTFPSAADYQKGQDATTDISWADIFLDGIHSDDQGTADTGGITTDTSSLGSSIHGATQQLVHSQPSVVGGQLQIHIPTHLQASLTSNAVQQASTNICGTVAYLAPSASTQQQVGTAGRIQNVVTVAGQHQVGQQQHQGNAKLVQISSSFPMASVQQLAGSVPIQTLLQSNQALTGQTIYGSQGTGLFSAQGSVHIENPKVVNVNFGPHVIGSNGSGQQAIIQTAEGKRVLITNSQLQHLPQYLAPQSISLTQPLVGTQLISSAGGNVIRASMAPGTHTIVPVSTTGTPQQIVLPSGQTVIPQRANAPQGAITKNVVIRPLNHNILYQSGQIHSQPTLITSSGTGLQVVNTGGGQGGQVQLIAQPSMNAAGIGPQQLNQGTIMNLINNQGVLSGTGNQLTGLLPGQNIFVNGQMLNIGQLSGVAVPQLQVQHNSQGGVTLTNINTTAQFQPTTQHLVIHHNGQQMLLQPKSTQSAPIVVNTLASQRQSSSLQGSKIAATPTSNANSASSTPVLTPTPSTPTPTPTPDLISDSFDSGDKATNHGINILEQALAMSAIDLQSFEDEFNFLDNTGFQSSTTPPPSITPVPPVSKPKSQPTKNPSKSKAFKTKTKTVQPAVNVSVSNSTMPFLQPTAQFLNSQGQKVTISPQQKIITANGQVYVLSANGQQFILQPSASPSTVTTQLKPVISTANSINRTNISIPTSTQLQIKDLDQNSFSSNVAGQLKLSPHSLTLSEQQKTPQLLASIQSDNKIFIKASPSSVGTCKIETPVHSAQTAQIMFTTVSTMNNSSSVISQAPTLTCLSDTPTIQVKNQKITTLSGTFFKQEPMEALVKQEPATEPHQTVSNAQDLASMVFSMTNLPSTSLAVTTSSIVAMATPLVVSSSFFTTVTTTTTQSHQVTIMSTAQMLGSRLTSTSATPTSLPYLSVSQSQSTPLVLNSLAFMTSSTTPTTSKSNLKEKDPANIKSMIPIKIADTTLMFSLTPGQKEKLESQISSMSKKDQEGMLIHQQKIIRRSQQVQLLEQQRQQQKKLLQQQELQQQSQQPAQELQQQSQQPQLTFQQLQQQIKTPVIKLGHPVQVISRSELLSPPRQAVSGFPTTVQELMEKSDEQDTQNNFQSLSSMKRQEQPQQIHQTSAVQQSHPNLQQKTFLSDHSVDQVQQIILPQMGRCLAEQQLLRDRSLALSPDVNTPFKSISDAMRRLVRYHTLQDHKPEEDSKIMKTWDTRYNKLCDYLVKKKRCYLRRFSKVQLYRDMCPNKRPEYIQNLMCFNEQLRELIDSEKEMAKSNPELFEPINPGNLVLSHNVVKSTVNPEVVNFESDIKIPTGSGAERRSDALQSQYFTVKETPTDPDAGSEKCDSPNASPSSQKRKIPDKGSTGTLKLVLKRRTTDNFIVKKSLGNVAEHVKPATSAEKSDIEYDFDTQTTTMAFNQPVIVRQRALSVSSRQTSSDASSDNSSFISQTDKVPDHSSVEEDEEDDGEEEDVDKSSDEDDDGEQSIEEKPHTKRRYSVSFGSEVDDNDIDVSCSVSADAFMETDEIIGGETLHDYKMATADTPGNSLFKFTDHQHVHSVQKSFNNDTCNSVDVLSSNLSYPLTDSPPTKNQLEYDQMVGCSSFSFESNPVGISDPFGPSCTASSALGDEFISESSVSNMEKEAANTGLPNSSLFATPNKSLLETDAMFISDDEDDLRDSRRVVSTFEIDNKDPQSSMINESVRSAINSVLGDDDSDDSQTSWTSATHRQPSSSVNRNLFHSLSASIARSHDADLDAAVQSILN